MFERIKQWIRKFNNKDVEIIKSLFDSKANCYGYSIDTPLGQIARHALYKWSEHEALIKGIEKIHRDLERKIEILESKVGVNNWHLTNEDGSPKQDYFDEPHDWVLVRYKENDTGWINPIPHIAEWVRGRKLWQFLNADTKDSPYYEYYKNVTIISWKDIE